MLIAAAALLAAVQTDAPDLQCILDRMPAATRSALLDESVAEGTMSRPAADSLVAAVDACRQQRGWDDNTAASFSVLAHSFITGEQSRDRLQRGGLNPQLITAWFDAQTLEARTDMQITDATMERLFAHLRGAGVTDALIEAQVESIGAFYASLVLIERLHEGMPVD